MIGFDADDTLWVNEDYYRGTEKEYAALLKDYGDEEFIMDELFQTEMKNLELYGYGVKPFIISMVENAIRISGGSLPVKIIQQVLQMGREMLMQPIELLPGVKEVIEALHGRYKLIVATKGDLLDQERKLKNSSLSNYFHHIEIMSDKTIHHYSELLRHLEIEPQQFVMIGNSLRSDILPPYELGCSVIHVPYSLTWQHEMNVKDIPEGERFFKVKTLPDVLEILNS